MKIMVMTGPSGAGKTHALHSFEDATYYTVDNLPPRLLAPLAEFCLSEGFDRAAVVIDTRCGPTLSELPAAILALRKAGHQVETLFLDSSDDALVQRFKETRRPHPLFQLPTDGIINGGILEAIQAERKQLKPLRALADRILDTSSVTPTQLRDLLHAAFAPDSRPGLLVTITSFGFKYGLPIDADLVFDVRFLVNPHYVPALRRLDGRDAPVAEYVYNDPLTIPFQDKMEDLVVFALPQYQKEGKAYLNIAIGCTGGRHRSVALSEDLAARLRRKGYHVALRHRDVGRDRQPQDLDTSIPSDDAPFDQPDGGWHMDALPEPDKP